MSKVGKIVLDNNSPNAYVIISDNGNVSKGLSLIITDDSTNSLKIKQEDVTKLKYRGKKIDDRSIDLTVVRTINNLTIREIGVLSFDTYYKLLIKFITYNASRGANDPSYLQVREDVHDQAIKMLKK